MGALHNEPSMEDILSSIKRIISDGSERPQPPRGSRARAVDADDAAAPAFSADRSESVDPAPESDPVLELTERMDEAPAKEREMEESAMAEGDPRITGDEVAGGATLDHGILSDRSAQAARESLSHLSALLVRPEEGESNTLEGLVREMLRPMLKDWMEANLPDLVETLVKREIDRIVGRLG